MCTTVLLMVLHGMILQRGSCWHLNHCFPVACSYLSQRPLFVTGDGVWSQHDWRITCVGISGVSNDTLGLYWWYCMGCIHKDAVAAMHTTVLLLPVPICQRGCYLSLVIYRAKMSEPSHVWLSAMWKMKKQVHINHFVGAVLTKRRLLWCAPLFCCCLFPFIKKALFYD
jgi:hypothetical protein